MAPHGQLIFIGEGNVNVVQGINCMIDKCSMRVKCIIHDTDLTLTQKEQSCCCQRCCPGAGAAAPLCD